MFSPALEHFLKINEGKKIVFTNGCFDILHRGHVTYLNEAKKLGDLLIVGVNSDASVKRLKGPGRPINNEQDRSFVLSQLRAVDFTEIFTEDTPLNLILKVRPQVLVKGGDWKIDQIVGGKEVIAWGGEVFSLNFVDGYSTTSVIQKISAK
jgi:D-beta-D-heptose 7-phosphate kinase/D-beta-D-heptose 1-phosphate adenosyltransferase